MFMFLLARLMPFERPGIFLKAPCWSKRLHTATQQMTPGTVSHAEKLVGWYVTVHSGGSDGTRTRGLLRDRQAF